MKAKGSITVFLSIVLMCMMMLVTTMLEGARIISTKSYMNGLGAVVTDSIMGSYARELFDDYGVLFCYTGGQNLNDMSTEYFEDNLGQQESAIRYNNLFKVTLVNSSVNNQVYATSCSGRVFAAQVVKLMEQKLPVDAIMAANDRFSSYEKADTEDVEKIKEENKNKKDELSDGMEDIAKSTSKVHSVKGNIKEYVIILHKEDTTPVEGTKAFNEMKKYVNKILPLMDDTLLSMEKYEQQHDGVTLSGELFSDREALRKSKQYLALIEPLLEVGTTDITNHFREKNTEIQSLINRAYERVDQFCVSSVVNEKPEKKDSVIEYIDNLIKKGKLSLVVEDVSKLSQESVSMENNPSNISEFNESDLGDLADKTYGKILFTQYLKDYFGSYVNEKKDTALKYEIEYCINGKTDDQSNLSGTVDKLVIIREGFNFAYIMKTPKMVLQCQELAISLMGWTGIPPLITAAKYLIMAAWSTGESIVDVKNLLSGGKVPLVKNESQWNLNFEGLAKLGEETKSEKGNKGYDYFDYLRCIIISQKYSKTVARTMDVIELNIKKRYNRNFAFSKCVYSGQCVYTYKVGHVFPGLIFGDDFTQTKEFAYFEN